MSYPLPDLYLLLVNKIITFVFKTTEKLKVLLYALGKSESVFKF